MRFPLAAVFLACLISACGGSGTGPSGSLSGEWSGTVTAVGNPAFQIKLSMTQSGSSVTGTWRSLTATGVTDANGTISGSVNGASFSGTMNLVSCREGGTTVITGNTGPSLSWSSDRGFTSTNSECRTNPFRLVATK